MNRVLHVLTLSASIFILLMVCSFSYVEFVFQPMLVSTLGADAYLYGYESLYSLAFTNTVLLTFLSGSLVILLNFFIKKVSLLFCTNVILFAVLGVLVCTMTVEPFRADFGATWQSSEVVQHFVFAQTSIVFIIIATSIVISMFLTQCSIRTPKEVRSSER
jgi:glucan phosphoethanolaminetransferase (alkaline phosphatase superfamily)